ncbi:MAG TPA: GEVED domain-containing protein [Gammaproteobacteria bacterium]|nr:GEVED domain-containing protein [Gammaproteobacteria bacterium]
MLNTRISYPLRLTLLFVLMISFSAEAGLVVPLQNSWPNALIPYQLDPSLSVAARDKVVRAIQEYHLRTGVRFVKRTPENAAMFPNYKVIMLDPTATYNNAGSIGVANGATIVRLTPTVEPPPVNGGLDFGLRTIIHELGHVAGLYHENSRLDMWDYFTIDWSLVIDPQCPNQRETNLIGTPVGPYDYFSVMDALPPFCARNELGGPSLEYLDPVDPTVSWQDLRGRMDNVLSAGDVAAIESIYGPKPLPLDLDSSQLAPFAGQDTGIAEILNDGASLSLSGAAWQATGVTFSITSASVLDFDFTSLSQGEIHAIGLAADDSVAPENFFQIYGSTNWANRDYNYTGGGAPQHFSIYLGDRYAGTTMRLVFVNSPAAGTSDGNSVFSNVVLSKGVTVKPTLAIASPLPDAQYLNTDTITLSASLTDVPDGSLDGQIRWYTSRGGFLGQGASLNVNLSVGAHVITANVVYPDGSQASNQVNIKVKAPNRAPTILILDPCDQCSGSVKYPVKLSAYANDLEDGNISSQVRWTSSIDGVVISPAVLSAGTHIITASITDSGGLTAAASVTVTMRPNAAPTILILTPCDNCSISVKYPVTFNVYANDAEDGNISSQVRLTSSIDGVITSPAILSAGTHIITASVTDSLSATTTKSITLTMRPNAAPTVQILSPANQSSFSVNNNPVTISVSASDAEDGNISSQVRLTSSIDGVITSPANLSAGTHIVTASVTDSLGATTTKSITLTMRPNAAPTVSILSPGDQGSISVNNNPVTISVSASDAEDGNLDSQVHLSSSIDGVITSPANLSAGTHIITANVTDSLGLTTTASITLTMRPNAAPQLTIASPANGQTFQQPTAVTLAAQATDPEDGNIASRVTWRSSIDGTIVSPASLSVGTHTLTATVTDNQGLSASASVQITVSAPPPSYCSSRGTDASAEWVAGVKLGGVNYASGSNGGYLNATAQTFNVRRGLSTQQVLTPAFKSSKQTEYWAVWIDLNRDGQFAGSEQLYSGSGTTARTANITIPSGTATGTTRMRVSMKRGSLPQPCESFTRGEVEDYTVNIQQ